MSLSVRSVIIGMIAAAGIALGAGTAPAKPGSSSLGGRAGGLLG